MRLRHEQPLQRFETGALRDWVKYEVELPGLGKLPGKLFLKDQLALTSCEVSINAMLPGQGMPIHHTHQENEELYLFIHGQGQMQLDEVFDAAFEQGLCSPPRLSFREIKDAVSVQQLRSFVVLLKQKLNRPAIHQPPV